MENTGKQIHYVLKDTTRNLTSKDLLRIIEIAEQARAKVHISYGTHQIFIGVPQPYQFTIAKVMKDVGFRYKKKPQPIMEEESFLLIREQNPIPA